MCILYIDISLFLKYTDKIINYYDCFMASEFPKILSTGCSGAHRTERVGSCQVSATKYRSPYHVEADCT